MPKLKTMEIWNGLEGLAALFKYEFIPGHRQRSVITWRATWPSILESQVIDAWEEVDRGREDRKGGIDVVYESVEPGGDHVSRRRGGQPEAVRDGNQARIAEADPKRDKLYPIHGGLSRSFIREQHAESTLWDLSRRRAASTFRLRVRRERCAWSEGFPGLVVCLGYCKT